MLRYGAILISLLIAFYSDGQTYFANGNAQAIGNQCYQLTSATDWQLGSVWYADKLDISKDFDLEFYLNFGSRDAGADGIVFVMQTAGNKAIGKQGGGMGFEGFSPSLGVEFDDFYNSVVGDITTDHIAILKNGSVDHNSANSISSPISAIAGGLNIEDGKDHLIRIKWNASVKNLQVWFDCNLRQSVTLDIQKTIFNDENLVYWGFTSATGGENNKQVACLRDDILVQDTFPICKGDTILLNARESKNNEYKWSPNLYLSDTTIRTPACSSTIPMTYYVEYKDLCDRVFKDTVNIDIDLPFVMDEIEDSLLCDGESYMYDLRTKYDSVRWSNNSRAQFGAWFNSGNYRLRAWQGVCYDDDSMVIRTNVSPNVTVNGERFFCENDSTQLSLDISPNDVTWVWPDGSLASANYFNQSDTGFITASNECKTVEVPFAVAELIIPKFSLGADTILCVGDTLTFELPFSSAEFAALWSDGSTGFSTKATTGGKYWAQVNRMDLCFASDSIEITEIEPPELGSLDDVVLCINEEIELIIENKFGVVSWNNAVEGQRFVLKNYDGELSVTSTNICGIDSKVIDVDLIDCFCDLWFPNAFTPNNDNRNETFKPTMNCPKLAEYELRIYNRWGEQLFVTNDINEAWEADFKNSQVPNGVYFFKAYWTGIENGFLSTKTDKGTIQVLR